MRAIQLTLMTSVLAVGLQTIPAGAQSLADTLVTAYTNSPDLAGARAAVKVSGENAVQARSQGRPTIAGTATFDVEFDDFNEVVFPNTL
ncbi:MAG: hypothetical protein AAGG47_18425 [Pseudomonadota bacterium]